MTSHGPTVLASLVLLAACQTPTEITVVMSSRDLACTSGDLLFADLSILARPEAAELVTASENATSSACKDDAGGASLGSIVLTPLSASRRAELLVVAGVKLPNASPPTATSAVQCLADYRSFLQAGAPVDYCKQPGRDCGACIVSRRSIGFVEHTQLELDVELTARCQGVFCKASETCGKNGDCVPAETGCEKGKCDLPPAGTGGAGGSGAGGSGGGGGTGGAGGAGGGCIAPGNGGPIQFTKLSPSAIGARDIAADGLGSAWVALPNAIAQCSTTACATAYTPATSSAQLLRIAASGSTVAAIRQNEVVHRTGTAPWSIYGAPASCALAPPSLTDVATTPGAVYFSGLDAGGGFASTADDPTCDKPLLSSPSGPSPRLWAFDGGSLWLSGDDLLFHNVSSTKSVGVGPLGGFPDDLWGFTEDATHQLVFGCNAAGLFRVRFDSALTSFSAVQIAPFPCLSVSGIDRCDGTADVWALDSGGTIEAFHLGGAPNVSATPGLIVLPANNTFPVGLAVDRDSVWLAGQLAISRSPRPLLP